ncbi:unnamed protein product [Prunus armeniaca]|uniref:Uncharacterized protein n=2 Tax=Prunus armeniaca TaxID=36596 RepID=A0A6J5TRS1_PRUAR|nr:unnamed protein product [Prunus armeniaca]
MDFDGKVTPNEVAVAPNYLNYTLGKEGIQELIGNLSKDKDEKNRVEDIVKLGSRTEDANQAEDEGLGNNIYESLTDFIHDIYIYISETLMWSGFG